MKKILLIAVLSIFTTPALAEEPIYLPGNTVVLPNNGSNVVIQGYDSDDLLYRRIINPYAGPRYRARASAPNDPYAFCAGIDRERKRERCIEDVNKDREKLIRKYD